MNYYYYTSIIVLILFDYCGKHSNYYALASGPCVLLEPHSPGSICIPLGVINGAFAEARTLTGLREPFTAPYLSHHHEEVDKLGLALTETSRILAEQFHLDWYHIYKNLPNLDVSLTDIWDFCPTQFRPKTCAASKYRSLTGHCNNLNHPDWGATFVPFANILPPSRTDGISSPRVDYDGGYLPSARLVSSVMHRDAVIHDHSITIMLIAWGQIIDHDLTRTADTTDPVTLKEPDCCETDPYGNDPKQQVHHNCFPIEIPPNDPFYSRHGRHCMNFLRSYAGVRSDCRLGPRVAFNTISSYIDSNFAYGSTYEDGSKLRAGKYGLLKSLPVFQEYGLKDLLPPKIEEPDDGCIRHNSDVFCFMAGDNRVNEQLVLTILHTIFMREHNRIAENLYDINPHWDDETIFQEARRIVIATTQHITFNEFLPMILGKNLMSKYGLNLEETGYWNGYDETVNPTAADEFITSAFRFGHSLLPNRIERWSLGHRYIDSEPLHKLLRQPYDLYRPGYIDTFIMGLTNQLAQAMDEGVTEEVTTLLFKEPKRHYGMDLAAMNLQRGREHGVPGYTAYRKICGLSPVDHWDDLIGPMRNETVYKYKTVYKSPHDIDLWSGGVSEISAPGSLLGPTFGCIIAQQFQAIRYGDRFWYELPNWPSSFTPAQLEEIRKVKLSRLLCDNSDDVKTIQLYAMVLPDPDMNPRVSCQGLRLSGIDFEHWREIPAESEEPPTHLPEHHPHYDHPSHSPHVIYKVPLSNNETYSGHEHGKHLEEDELKNPYRLPPITAPSYSKHHDNDDDNAPENLYSTHENIFYEQPPSIIEPNLPPIPEYEHNFEHSLHVNKSISPIRTHNINDEHYPYTTASKTVMSLQQQNTVEKFVSDPSLEKPRVFAPQPPPRPPPPPPPRRIVHKELPRIKPFPENQPFPGLDGLFSPNPGYLVKQRFMIYKIPRHPLPPPRQSIWQKLLPMG